MSALIEVDNVSVSYGAIRALHEVSVSVGTGETVVILGANGAGKTTLLRTIMGLLRPRSGTILFDGRVRLDKRAPHQINRLGISWSPEGRQVFANLTVEENLRICSFGSTLERLDERIDLMFDRFPVLHERREQLAGQLSGGQQQMLALARALVNEPQLLILDEPSLGLAPLVVRDMFGLIEEMRGERSVLLVEQNAAQSLKLADRAYVFDRGQVVLEGTAAEVSQADEVRAVFLGK